MNNKVSLRLYLPSDKVPLERFELPEEQVLFSALPKDVLDEANRDEYQYPVVITYEEIPAGFFILHEGPDIEEFTVNPDAMLLRSFSIDYRYQGQGLAKTAMLQLPEFMKSRFPGHNEVALAVNKRNKVAQAVYMAAGFQDKGKLIEGPIGPQHIYHLALN
ncbi:GNAT family N-acetyltransferase [Paenibacillus sp. YSY-4.3]